ncbi:DUF5988 family protein [Streptomyces radicis]|uniref:Uncharacterized protein n=1 Tax=Streptomyces radicis TaxID=1750517 RepID=A0A3A9WR74_9ACTN|nr:DUF5988 family protein [Streptomyces radicis]RKN12024.1 hypothetical protein D7319_03745 [Streptomyces radicis]RKN26087.1 hypothetical protein D7318_06735 [Streptomyces radicis]
MVFLIGGPLDLPRLWTAPQVRDQENLKIQHGNGYEHFSFAEEYRVFQGSALPVYRWRRRTFIAE